MNGRKGRRHYSGEVRLVRVRAHDERLTERRKRKTVRMTLLLALFLVSAACLGKFCSLLVTECMGTLAPQSPVEPEQKKKQSEEIMGKPAPIVLEDLVMLSEENRVPLVAIDPGHGGEDDGCYRDGVSESKVNLELAKRLDKKLQALGYETMMIREDDETQLDLEERVEKAAAARADIYVSIHQNAYDGNESGVSGIETWYCSDSEDSRRLARLIHKAAVERTGACDREARETDELYVVREAAMPSCLIETSFLSDGAERAAITSEAYQEKLAEGMAQGIEYYFHPKTMYLTFDDGPSEDNTQTVLDILKERGVKATFFVVGENVEKHPEVARRIVEEGHTIGIHCYNHDYQELYKSVDSYLEDFQKAHDAVYQATGVEAVLFRFPGGSINSHNKGVYQDIIKEMTQRGYIYYDWNASLEDAVKQSTPEELLRNGIDSTLGRRKVVMLGHDILYDTTQCLGDLIDSLPEYEMKPLNAQVEPIRF